MFPEAELRLFSKSADEVLTFDLDRDGKAARQPKPAETNRLGTSRCGPVRGPTHLGPRIGAIPE